MRRKCEADAKEVRMRYKGDIHEEDICHSLAEHNARSVTMLRDTEGDVKRIGQR